MIVKIQSILVFIEKWLKYLLSIDILEKPIFVKIRNTIIVIAPTVVMSAFVVYYYFAKTHGIRYNNLYWFANCLGFLLFSLVTYFDHRKKIYSIVSLLSFFFFLICFIFSFIDWLACDKFKMNGIYIALRWTFIISIIIIVYKWIKYVFYR